MSEQHTQGRLMAQVESYAIADTGDYDANFNIRAEGNLELLATVCGCDDDEANARRLVACWNACDGISTEALERLGTIDRARVELDVIRVQAITQRDELLEALGKIADGDLGEIRFHANYAAMIERTQSIASEAIAKVEGGAA